MVPGIFKDTLFNWRWNRCGGGKDYIKSPSPSQLGFRHFLGPYKTEGRTVVSCICRSLGFPEERTFGLWVCVLPVWSSPFWRPLKSSRNYSFAFPGSSMAREVPRALNTKLLNLPKTRECRFSRSGPPRRPKCGAQGASRCRCFPAGRSLEPDVGP